jgi:hypothetical protein
MAKRSFAHINWTPGATADATTLAAGYMALKGGSATQLIDILEFTAEGMAGASNPTPLILGYDSTIGTTPTALGTPDSDGPMNPATAALALPPVSYVAATTNPQRSSSTSSPKLTWGINAFGGIIRYNISPTQQISILGSGTSTGEISISCYTGGTPGLIQSHLLYEPY